MVLYAKDGGYEPGFSRAARLQSAGLSYSCESKSNFHSEENYKRLTSTYNGAKTNKAYNASIREIYKFVDQYPEDMYSVDLLKSVAIFFPVWEADVNIPLFYKIACTQKHPKIYEALIVLWCYSDEYDKRFEYHKTDKDYVDHKVIVMPQLTVIADDKYHPRQKNAKDFLDAIGKDWDDL